MSSAAKESLTVIEAANRYLNTLSPGDPAQTDVLRFARWFEDHTQVRSMRGHDVATWVESLSPSSPLSQRQVESVRTFLGYLRKQGLSEINLASHVRFRRAGNARGARASSPADLASQRRALTPEGHAALIGELEALKGERPAIAQELSRAMADRDFRENAPLDAARDKQAHLEARIRETEEMLRSADVVGGAEGDAAGLGCSVTLRNLESKTTKLYTLVSPNEVSPSEGKISTSSPVGRAILGRRAGEEVQVTTPAGVVAYLIESVRR